MMPALMFVILDVFSDLLNMIQMKQQGSIMKNAAPPIVYSNSALIAYLRLDSVSIILGAAHDLHRL
jgi:hypothetical protein